MEYSFLNTLSRNLEKYAGRNAFYIEDRFYTYASLHRMTRWVYTLLGEHLDGRGTCIGVLTTDCLETYASVLAVWYSGNIFVPLNPANPVSRNQEIIRQAGIEMIIDTTGEEVHAENYPHCELLRLERNSPDPASESNSLRPLPAREYNPDEIRYLIFTSGTTGVPKGVPITAGNLDAFIHDFLQAGYELGYRDRCLQIYDFSFDASVHCYTVPLAAGACIYTVPQNEIRYLHAYRLMKDQELTFVKMPPSTLAYLMPFFREISLPRLRYCLLGGEALYHELVRDWNGCVPNAIISNVYGPTEATINCTHFRWQPDIRASKQHKGIVSIGKPFGGNRTIVVDAQMNLLPQGEQGELCVSGPQVTPGYWGDGEKNREAFFELEIDGTSRRYYRTGDLVYQDGEGDLAYCGRMDEQVQMDGFRVELSEIEVHARAFLKQGNVAAVAFETGTHTAKICLFIEQKEEHIESLRGYLAEKLPRYMYPAEIMSVDELPKSAGGKINKAALKNKIS